MEFNQYNSQLNQVPPYPQANFDFRNAPPSAMPVVSNAKNILDYKDSPESFVNSVLRTAIGKEATFYFSYPSSSWETSSRMYSSEPKSSSVRWFLS